MMTARCQGLRKDEFKGKMKKAGAACRAAQNSVAFAVWQA